MLDLKQNSSRYLDKEGLADYLGISVSTINARICQRRIPHIKMGRRVLFDVRDIDKWVEEQKVVPLSDEKNLDF